MKRTAIILTLVLALTAGLSSCLKENDSDCENANRVALRFIFTHHDQTQDVVTDLFADKVNDVEVYIFDANDRYVYHLAVQQPSLTDGNTLYLDLDEGEYKIVTWGNLNDSGYGVDAPEQTRADYTISAIVTDPDISDLFHGTTELTVDGTAVTQEIQLTRNTHMIHVHLLGLSEPTRSVPGTDYSVRVEGSNNIYDFENNPVAQSAATYIPTYTSLTSGEHYIVRADFKVQRLFTDGDMVLTIYKGDNLDRTDNIIPRILDTYEEITTNADLDRQYEYNLYYVLDEQTGAWIFVGNNILDWEGPSMPGEL